MGNGLSTSVLSGGDADVARALDAAVGPPAFMFHVAPKYNANTMHSTKKT